MIDKVLKNLIYLIYPRNICAYKEKNKYFNSEEYKRLNQIINEFDNEEGKVFRNSILKKFENDKTLQKITDFTLFSIGDRCMTFNVTVLEKRELYTISLFLSVILPYYVVEVKKNKIELYFSESEITNLENDNTEERSMQDLVLEIETVIEDEFLFKKFPNELINYVVDDISFQDSEFGYFTMYNAFFNNVIIKKNES
ncbi:hypothetical protein ACWA1F_19585 [Flavobacterium sp. 3-218]